MKIKMPTAGQTRIKKRFQIFPKTLKSRMSDEREKICILRFLEFVEIEQKCFNEKDGWQDDRWYDV